MGPLRSRTGRTLLRRSLQLMRTRRSWVMLMLSVVASGCDPGPASEASSSATAMLASSPATFSPASDQTQVAPRPPAAPSRSDFGRTIETLQALRGYRNLTLSRDGRRVAYNVVVEPFALPSLRSVFVIDRGTPTAMPQLVSVSAGKKVDERSPEFSPDGKSLALLSEVQGGRQLYIVDLSNTSISRRVGRFDGTIAAPRFAPDGQHIALLHTERASPTSDPAAPAVVGTKVTPQRVSIIDLATDERHFASPPELHVHSYDWSPDGRSVVMVASRSAPHPNYFVAKLYVVAAAGGEARMLAAPERQLGDPQFSPDGRWIAFISGLMSDEGNTGGDLFILPASGGTARNLTSGRKASITAARWSPDSSSLVVNEMIDGHFTLSAIPLDGGSSEVLFRSEATLRGLSLSADGATIALLHETFDSARSIWSGPPRAPVRIEATRQRFEAAWGPAQSLHVANDHHSIQSFLIGPRTVEAGHKYPLITLVHGGPASAWTPEIFEYLAATTRGYYLLLPNPRGSFGLGEAFQEANVKDLGYGDLRDIRASVQAALAAAPIDADRVGIMGWSYGGFMAMWAPTQGSEFRAAVAGADKRTYHGGSFPTSERRPTTNRHCTQRARQSRSSSSPRRPRCSWSEKGIRIARYPSLARCGRRCRP